MLSLRVAARCTSPNPAVTRLRSIASEIGGFLGQPAGSDRAGPVVNNNSNNEHLWVIQRANSLHKVFLSVVSRSL